MQEKPRVCGSNELEFALPPSQKSLLADQLILKQSAHFFLSLATVRGYVYTLESYITRCRELSSALFDFSRALCFNDAGCSAVRLSLRVCYGFPDEEGTLG